MNAAPSFREVLQQGSLEPPQVLTLCELIVHVVRTRQRTIAGWRNVSIGERWDGGCRLHWFWVEALAERISDQESKETFYGVKNVLRAAAEAEQMVQRLRAAGSGALSAADIAAAPAEDVARFFARTVRFAEGLLEANRSCADPKWVDKYKTAILGPKVLALMHITQLSGGDPRQHALTVGELDGVSSSLAALGVTAPQEVRDATGHEQPQAERDLVVEHLLASITQYLYICEELVIDT